MKLEKKLDLTLTDEEISVIDKAAHILKYICYAYVEHNACDECPLSDMCRCNSWDVITPHNHLFKLINK